MLMADTILLNSICIVMFIIRRSELFCKTKSATNRWFLCLFVVLVGEFSQMIKVSLVIWLRISFYFIYSGALCFPQNYSIKFAKCFFSIAVGEEKIKGIKGIKGANNRNNHCTKFMFNLQCHNGKLESSGTYAHMT